MIQSGIVALTAPSGAGKTTIAHRLLAALPDLRFSVSATTRPPRPHERNGVDYHFVTPERFAELAAAGALLEYEEVYPGRFYGTLVAEVERALERGSVLLDVDVKGALNVKKLYGDRALTIFIAPPSIETLESRLRARNTETEATLAARLARARSELGYAGRFDRTVVNDGLEEAVAETLNAVRSFLGA